MINVKEASTNELLKLVVQAGDEFYMNKDHGLHLTDLEYDEALDELKLRNPEFDIFKHLKGLNGHDVYHRFWMPSASKVKVNNITWLVLELKLETIYGLLQDKGANLNEVPFILNYRQGRLKFVTFPWVLDVIDQVTPSDLPGNIFPKQFPSIQGNFRLVGTCSLSPTSISNVTILGRLTETETEMVDVLKIRSAYVKTDHYINTTIVPVDCQLPDWFTKLDDERKFDQWWQYVTISYDTKFTPKMDGCSIVAYYKDGNFDFIASRSNDVVGKMKSDYLEPFFPAHLNHKGNLALMCESVIDLGYGLDWNSRQQANGLINSKYKLGEIAKFLNFVCYDCIDIDNNCRVDLNDLRQDIYANNQIDKVTAEISKKCSLAYEGDISDILEDTNILRNHLCAVQCIDKSNENWKTQLVMATEIPQGYNRVIFDNFKQNRLDEINQEWSEHYTKFMPIEKFEHGIYGGIRYALVVIGGVKYYFFDSRDFQRHRVTTVDYFKLIDHYKYIDDVCQAHYHHSDGGVYLNDGIVVHRYQKNPSRAKTTGADPNTEYPFHEIYKWTFNEVAETEVEDIIWQESEFGTLIPVILFKSVKVEGSWLSRASGGGLSHLKALQCGPGSKIKVVRVNSTIPMVIQVLTKATFELPKCPHCGRQLTWNEDVYETLGGAKIMKCSNLNCEGKFKTKEWFTNPEFEFNLDTDLIKVLGKLINIESYQPRTEAAPENYQLLKDSILNGNLQDFLYLAQRHVFVNMNRDKLNSFLYNATSAFKAIRIKIGKEIIIKEN